MKRPYIICHMLQSQNGKVTGSFLGQEKVTESEQYYYEIHRNLQANAFACGRVTMEGSFTKGWYPDLSKYQKCHISKDDYKAKEAGFYAVAFDRKGKLGWKESEIHDEDPGYDQAHIIEVLCKDLVSDAYLAYLREMEISYIFAGEKELDISIALEKLSDMFGIELLLLEGGPIINKAFELAECIDELSLVTSPVIARDGDDLFHDVQVKHYQLKDRYELENQIIYTTYQKEFLCK